MNLAELEKQSEQQLASMKRSRAARYLAARDRFDAAIASEDPDTQAKVARAHEGIVATKAIGPGQVHNDSTLSNISIQYANGDYIGESLMPVVPVPKLSDKYFVYNKRDRLAYPDDKIGPRGTANEISESRSLDNYSCDAYALKNYVDELTLANQDAPLNEMVDLVESVSEAIAFKREKRILSVVLDASLYPSGNKVTLTGSDRWDSAGGGNPVKVIQDALASLWSGRGPTKKVLATSLDIFNWMSRHPMILDLFKYGGTAPGLATPSMISKFFGIDEFHISEAREDTANSGQTASYGRLFGKFMWIGRVAQRPTTRTASFGYVFRFGQVKTDEWFDKAVGSQGGYYARVSTHEDEKVVAADTGYLITSPIS